MVKKLLAMVLGVTMLIGATGCSAVDTGSGTGTSDTKSDTQVSVNADLLDATQYKSDKEAADWTIAVVVKDGTSDWFKRMQVGVDEFGQTKTVNVIQKGPAKKNIMLYPVHLHRRARMITTFDQNGSCNQIIGSFIKFKPSKK
jgi:simple sugar transport system substrate-binding protein